MNGERPIGRAHAWRLSWLVLGLANLAAGVFIALRPGQSQDLNVVVSWCRDWLLHGLNPYPGAPGFTTNYPPYALVALSPLAAIPEAALHGTWAVIGAGLAILVGWLGLRVFAIEQSGRRILTISIGFVLTWECVRIGLGNGQFTLLAMSSGLAAIACRRPILRGVLLAVAMTKPQIGIAFALWAMLSGSLASLLVAGATMAVGTVIFAVRLGESPLQVALLYGDVLRRQLAGDDLKQGALELRPLLRDLMSPAIGDLVQLVFVAGGLAALVLLSRRMDARDRARFLLPLACLWTLMSVYHLTYDFVLLWPAYIAIAQWPASAAWTPALSGTLAALQLVLMVDVPGLWWKLNGRAAMLADGNVAVATILHFNRLLILTLFVCFLTAAWRRCHAATAILPASSSSSFEAAQ